MEDFIDLNFEKTTEDTRELELNDNRFTITRTDPFGFYKVSVAKGDLPQKLSGMFTSHLAAQAAVEGYVNGKHST